MKSLGTVFNHLIEEARQEGELRSLLIDTRREEERPHVTIDGKSHVLGLIDEQPMLMRVDDRALVNPAAVVENVTELSWRLKR